MEAAFDESIARNIAQRRQQKQYPHIPHELYVKAADHQEQLTEDERRLLLSRGDLVGKALAYPDSLTEDEIHGLLLWAPPDVVRANIQRVTGGTLSTPTELYTKAKEAIERGDLETTFSDEAIKLPTRGFYALDDPNYDGLAIMSAIHINGYSKAIELHQKQLRLDGIVFQASAMYTVKRRGIDAGRQGEWEEMERSRREKENLVPESVNAVLVSAQNDQWDHDIGNLTDQEFILRTWQHLSSLKSSTEASPISYAPLHELIQSLSVTQQAYNQGQASMEYTIGCNIFAFNLFNSTRMASVARPEAIVEPRVSESDMSGSGSWPPQSGAWQWSAYALFCRESSLSGGLTAESAWVSLTEAQKNVYRDRHEQFRLDAWDSHNRPPAPPSPPPVARVLTEDDLQELRDLRTKQRKMPDILTGLKLFINEQNPPVSFTDALARWEALTDAQQNIYDTRANTLYKAAWNEYMEGSRKSNN